MVRSLVGLLAKLLAAIAVASPLAFGIGFAQEPPKTDPGVALEAPQKSVADERTLRIKTMMRGYRDQLYKSGAPEIGNPDAKVSIVAFVDYNCPYCRSTFRTVETFLRDNPDTKLIIRDIAILGEDSASVSPIALASLKQGKFETMHRALMEAKGRLGEQRALDIAAQVGLDVSRLKADAQSPEVAAMVAETQALGKQMKVTDVPLFLVGHRGMAGAASDLINFITRSVEEIRTSGCDVC